MSNEDKSNASEASPSEKPTNVHANEEILAAFEANFLGQLEQLTSRVDVLEKERAEMMLELTSASETAEKLVSTLASTRETLKRVRDERNVVVQALEELKAEIGEIVKGLVERTVNKFDANATPVDNSDNSPNPLAPIVTLPTPIIVPSTPREGDSPSASEGDKAKSLSEKDIKNKAKKQQKTADKKRLAVAAKVAENAEQVKRASLKEKLDRIVKTYVDLKPSSKSQTEIEGFNEGKAKWFLAQRASFHEKTNIEVSVMATVIAQNMCPLLLKSTKKLFDIEQKNPDNVADEEMDMLAVFKMHVFSNDTYNFFKANDLENTQKYIKNFVENYKVNQTEVRAGRAKFHGDVNSKRLSDWLASGESPRLTEGLDWDKSKKYFNDAFAIYEAGSNPSEKLGYLELLFTELAREEHPVLRFDGYFMPLLLERYPDAREKASFIEMYGKMVFSVSSL